MTERDASTSRALALAADAAAGRVLSTQEVREMVDAAQAVLLREDIAARDEAAEAAAAAESSGCCCSAGGGDGWGGVQPRSNAA